MASASSELVAIPQRAPCDFQQSSPRSCPRKWLWTSGNGSFPGLFAFSACRLKMIFSCSVQIKECAIFNVQHIHPLRGTARVGRRRPARAVEASKTACSSEYVVVSPHPPAVARILFDAVCMARLTGLRRGEGG